MGTWTNTASASKAVSVTTSDTDNLTGGTCRALYVGTTGNLNVVMADDTAVLFKTVPVGIFPIQVKRVKQTSTTAAEIIALY